MREELRFSCAILDMDGTLIDSMGVWEEMSHSNFRRNGMNVPKDIGYKLFSMTFQESAEYFIEISGSDKDPQDLIKEWEIQALEYYKKDVKLKPYVNEFLEHLKKTGLKISLTTANFRSVAEDITSKLGISDYFDSMTFAHESSRSKAFPDMFLLAGKKMGCRSENCVVFEDSLTSVIGANAAGMYTVGVFDEHAGAYEERIKKEADEYIYSFKEMIENEDFFKLKAGKK